MNLNSTNFRSLALAGAAIALSLATGCHKKQGPDPNSMGPVTAPVTAPPPTASLTADPVSIDLGQSVVLNWRSTNANVVTIDGIGQVNANGTQTVAPSNSTNFHLIARGDGGSTEANVRVTVNVPVAPTPPPADASMDGSDTSDSAFHKAVADVFFDYDSYDLRPDAQSAVSAAASYLNSHTNVKVVIGGYCDDRGSAEYNLALGENRANSAKSALVSAGIAPGRIRVVSFGKEKQFCSEETESCWQQNRRAQFSVDR
jgi:peptidoglycan-associated lipoprotein